MAIVPDESSVSQNKHILKQDAGATYTYYGEANPGTATSAAKWSIMRKTNADNTILYADGGHYSQVWDDRASLSYA